MKNIKKALVKYNGTIVGYLAEIEEYRFAFQYDDSWIENGFSISPFSLPLSKGVFTAPNMNFNGLNGVFADSLPDGWGALLLRRTLIRKGINPEDISPLTMLCIVGRNGLGGLTYEPEINIQDEPGFIDLDEIADEVNKVLNDDESANLDILYKLGGSSGGARPKAHIRIDGDDWIVKFPCRIDVKDPGQKEYMMNELAKKCGISVNEHRLFHSDLCKGYFGAKRFDRKGGHMVHMVSLAALLETTHRIPNLDYIHLMQVTGKICSDSEFMYEVFRRMSFNVIFSNKDDHGKNFAFIYNDEKKTYELSPFYDITETKEKLEHEMTVNGNGNPGRSDLMEVSRIFGLSDERCREIIDDILIQREKETRGKLGTGYESEYL